jgi:hypothetical protein
MDMITDPFWTPALRKVLIKKLLVGSFAQREVRERVIEDLSLHIRVRMPYADQDDSAVEIVVEHCAKYAKGINSLIAKVQQMEEGSFWGTNFNAWLGEIGWSASGLQTVPYVVAAMTHTEAQELPTVIAGADKQHHYQTYIDTLQRSGVELTDLKAQYRATRGAWVPHLATEQEASHGTKYHERPITSIVDDFFREFNQRLSAQGRAALLPEDFTDRLFPRPQTPASPGAASVPQRANGLDEQAQQLGRMAAARLLWQGCILFIDPLSLFHPTILNGLKDAEIISKVESVAVLLLTPVTIHAIEVHWLANDMIGGFFPHTLLRRLPNDQLYEWGIDEIHFLKRRLATFLMGAQPIPRGARPAAGNEQALEARYGAQSGAMLGVLHSMGGAG